MSHLAHDGANAKFSTNWDETDYRGFFLRNCYCCLLDDSDTQHKNYALLDRALLHLEMDWQRQKILFLKKIIRSTIFLKFDLPDQKNNRIAINR